MEALMDMFERTIARNLVKYAAGTAIFCPRCGDVMDCKRTIVLSDGKREVVMCDKCYGRAPGNVKSGSITLYDGRVLWARPQRRK